MTNTQPPAAVRLITLDPAHFHAALVQKQMLPGVDKRVSIYAPLGADLIEHLKRIERFNSRPENPASWELDVHCVPDPIGRMLAERPGNVVMLAGRNSNKIDKILAALNAGFNVLADKPWIIHAAQMPALETALATASGKGLVAYDMMTERYEITSILQRVLVNEPAIFGEALPGSEREPSVFMESVHHIMKTVAGVPGLRPPFFFDIREEGEGLPDVGTHLVDLVPWILFPDSAIRCPDDIQVHQVERWPTTLTLAQYQRVTGTAAFPAELAPYLRDGQLDYYCNNRIRYSLRGVRVQLDVLWNWEAPSGDTHFAVFRGTRSRIEVRQGEKENFRPEVYVAPNQPSDLAAITTALGEAIGRIQPQWSGLDLDTCGDELRLVIPDRYRVGHEAHFAQVLEQFLEFFRNPAAIPAIEHPNMLAKYHVTTA